jgi:hypothetical protein
VNPAAASPNWAELGKAQQQALQPLSAVWDSLSVGHRRKWIAVTKNYASLNDAGKAKLNDRMVDWATLSPKDRELARLNFAETKTLAPTNRSADWEAYQALTPEEKQKLAAERANRKPNSAAIAIKPVSKNKLTAVPVTRRSPEPARELVTAKQALDRNTLLPKLVPPVAASNTPVQ